MSRELGSVLRQARRALNLTQEKLAKHVGVSRAAIGQWENGEDPSTDNLIRICGELGIEVQAAIEGTLIHKNGFASVLKKPDLLGNIDESREPLPLEKFPFNQKDYFVSGNVIPFFPTSVFGEDGLLAVTESPMFFASRPKDVPPNNDLHMIGVVGSPLDPYVKDMSMVYVDTGLIPHPGAAVLVRLLDTYLPKERMIAVRPNKMQFGAIGFFQDFTPSEIIVEQTSPPRRIRFETAEVASIHPILTPEMLAQG
jgi:transcriptional regulator with XRE-family HTH domain